MRFRYAIWHRGGNIGGISDVCGHLDGAVSALPVNRPAVQVVFAHGA